jgi:hypothetical protein
MKRYFGVVLLLTLLAAIGTVGYLLEHRLLFFWQIERPAAFVVIAVLLTAFAIVAGRAVTGLTWGVLIDDRNKMSLSRFQTALWTVVVLAAIFVAAVSNVGIESREPVIVKKEADGKVKRTLEDKTPLPGEGPLDFEIPGELWLVLGISVTSLIGAPMILEDKKKQKPDSNEREATLTALEGQGKTSADNVGLVIVNNDPKDARWTDLFQADETGNGAHLDLAKVQNFYFTLIVVFVYSAALIALFAAQKPILALPPVSEGMVALLTISHAAYLANKARTQSQTAPQS